MHVVLEMLNQRVKEYEQQLTSERTELATTSSCQGTDEEASLVHPECSHEHGTSCWGEERRKLEMQVSGLENKLSPRQPGLQELKMTGVT